MTVSQPRSEDALDLGGHAAHPIASRLPREFGAVERRRRRTPAAISTVDAPRHQAPLRTGWCRVCRVPRFSVARYIRLRGQRSLRRCRRARTRTLSYPSYATKVGSRPNRSLNSVDTRCPSFVGGSDLIYERNGTGIVSVPKTLIGLGTRRALQDLPGSIIPSSSSCPAHPSPGKVSGPSPPIRKDCSVIFRPLACEGSRGYVRISRLIRRQPVVSSLLKF